jgi:transposase-like protein
MKTKTPVKLQSTEELLSGPSIARILDVDPATVRRWRKEGAPHHLLGTGLIRYLLSEILAWRSTR